MFSKAEKIKIATAVEAIIREIDHPEMDNQNIRFHLHVDGRESWSWADIVDNKSAENRYNPNPWNEKAREVLAQQKKEKS